MNRIADFSFIEKEFLSPEDIKAIELLEKQCRELDNIALKLELDYKLACANESREASEEVNEFLCFDGERLIGYMGICGFGSMPLEVTGMVDPAYRRLGIFNHFYSLLLKEWPKRTAQELLLLSDRNSASGQAFIRSKTQVLGHTEFEMHAYHLLSKASQNRSVDETPTESISLRKATNQDAAEIAKQNAIYFGMAIEELPERLPEDEEKRGMTTYLAERSGQIVGKVNLQILEGLGAVFGLGVLPEFRGLGYGRAILNLSLENFRERGLDTAMLQVSAINDTALGLYKSCGFEVTSTMDYYSQVLTSALSASKN